MDHQQLKALARRADRAKGRKRERLAEALLEALPGLNQFEGFSKQAVWLAKFLARLRWSNADIFC